MSDAYEEREIRDEPPTLGELLKGKTKREIYSMVARLLGYEDIPPEIDTFLSDSAYLGDVLDGGKAVYEYWKAALRTIYPNPFESPYLEVVATGAIGIGKTTLAKVGSSYDISKMLLLSNPHRNYGLISTQKIEYAIINATMTLARSVIYDELIEWWRLSPFFSSFMRKNKSQDTLFPKRINIVSGSRPSHFIGRAIFGAILDEMNFQDKVENQAYENYTNVLRRLKSRFGTSKYLPGHLWLLSSKRRDSDPLQVHIERSRNDPSTIVFDAALWEVKKEKLNLSGKYFYVYAGDNSRDPFIIGDNYDHKVHYNLDESRIIRVPVEFRKDFEKDIFNAIRDLAGISVQGVHKFIPSVEAISSVMTGKNIVDKEYLEVDFYDKEPIMTFILPNIERVKNPILPNSPRFIHLDLALTKDYVGIASSFVMDYVQTVREDESGIQTVVKEPIVVVEWVIYIKAKTNQEIPLNKVRDFILDLKRLGYPIAATSADGYQSALLLQDLTQAGLKTQIVSVDRDYNPYLNLKRMIYEKRIVLPKSERLKRELMDLIDTGKKVDHPVDGSKDGADAVAGSVWLATNSGYSKQNPLLSLSTLSEEAIMEIALGY